MRPACATCAPMKEPEESTNRAFPDHQANLVDRSEFRRARPEEPDFRTVESLSGAKAPSRSNPLKPVQPKASRPSGPRAEALGEAQSPGDQAGVDRGRSPKAHRGRSPRPAAVGQSVPGVCMLRAEVDLKSPESHVLRGAPRTNRRPNQPGKVKPRLSKGPALKSTQAGERCPQRARTEEHPGGGAMPTVQPRGSQPSVCLPASQVPAILC